MDGRGARAEHIRNRARSRVYAIVDLPAHSVVTRRSQPVGMLQVRFSKLLQFPTVGDRILAKVQEEPPWRRDLRAQAGEPDRDSDFSPTAA